MFEHFHCFFFSAYSDDILTILFVEIVLCFAIDILATYPQPYPWTRAGVGQSSQDAESQTYPACSGELSLSFRPLSCLFTFFLASPWPWRPLSHYYFHPQVAHPLWVVVVLIAHSFITDIDNNFFLYTALSAYNAYNILLAVGSYSRSLLRKC